MSDLGDDVALAEFLYEHGSEHGRVPRYDAIHEEFVSKLGWDEDRFARAYARFRERMSAELGKSAEQN